MDTTDRFLARKRVQKEILDRHGLALVVNPELVDGFLASEIDLSAIQQIDEVFDRTYSIEYDIDVSDSEVEDILATFRQEFDKQRFDALVGSCKNNVLSTIIGPFGLGSLVAKSDKNGGNVTTVNNARQGVYAIKKDEYKREDYTNARSSDGKYFAGAGKNSIGSEFTRAQLDDRQMLTDGYTGNRERGSNTSPDHVVSTSQFHKDGGFMLSSENKADFATDTDNLVSTRRDINQSMRDHDKKDWLDNKQGGRDEANAEHYGVDRERVSEHYKRGTTTAEKHAPTISQKAKYYGARTAVAGAEEGVKMGTQQALGLVVCEFFSSVFDEIQDIYSKGFAEGFEDKRFLHVLKKRLMNIAKKVSARWKDACKAFSGGFISGFLSNLVTVVVNMFVRTGKRVVRVIREGFFSILKAIKMLCFPPEGMTLAQAAHEASKLIAAGLVVAGGIAVEQHIDNMIKAAPMLEPFADIITTVLVGGLTSLASTFIVYAIDRVDFFKVNASEEHDFVIKNLEKNIERMFAEGEEVLGELSYICP